MDGPAAVAMLAAFCLLAIVIACRCAGESDAVSLPASLVLMLAAVVRLPDLTATLPYLGYVDEGHVLHRVAHMLSQRTWDPGSYVYPSLLMNATALAAAAYGWTRLPGSPPDLAAAAARSSDTMYDLVEPASLIVIGRALVLVSSVATVGLIMVLAKRLMDGRAAVAAGIVAALLPAFVSRSAITIVDTPATCLVALALVLALGLRHGPGAGPGAGAAAASGVAAGLAAAAKYPAGAVLLAIAVAVLATAEGLRRGLWLVLLATIAAAAGFAAGMPAAILRPSRVWGALVYVTEYYRTKSATLPCLSTAWLPTELGAVFIVPAALGLIVLARRKASRPVVLGGAVFALALLSQVLRYSFQPFRNVLPLLPLGCVAVGAAAAWASERLVRAGRCRPEAALAVAATGAAGVALVMLWSGVLPYLRAHATTVDTRVTARQWLERTVGPGDRVLIGEELAFLPSELARLRAETVVASAVVAPIALRTQRFDYVIVGASPGTAGDPVPATLGSRPVLLRIGSEPTPPKRGYWRGNHQIVTIYGRPE